MGEVGICAGGRVPEGPGYLSKRNMAVGMEKAYNQDVLYAYSERSSKILASPLVIRVYF